MKKNYIHDIKPSKRIQKKSTAVKSTPAPRKTTTRKPAANRSQATRKTTSKKRVPLRQRREGSGRGVWYIAAATIIGLFFVLTGLLSSASIQVQPRAQEIPLDTVLLAKSESESPTDTLFNLIKIEGAVSMNATNIISEEKDDLATGIVILYNNHKTSAQTLVVDTRLRGSNDLIYYTKDRVSIPGKSGTTPGSIEVEVYSSEKGSEYNLGNSDFTVVGFEGTDKEETVYGRTKNEISGGNVGLVYSMEDLKKEEFKNSLGLDLKARLYEKAVTEIPEEYISYEKVTFLETSITDMMLQSDKENFDVRAEGTLYVYLFEKKKFEEAILNKIGDLRDSEHAHLLNLEELNFDLTLPAIIANDPENMTSLSITLSDDLFVVWENNLEEIKESLIGLSKKDFESTISAYPNVSSAELIIKPLWKQKIPSKIERVKISENLPV
jgi:hypothetical protein